MAAKVAQATPPVAVSGAHLLGYPIADAVLWLTALYLCLQIGYLVWKWGGEWRTKNRRKVKK